MGKLGEAVQGHVKTLNKIVPSSVVETALSFGNKWICSP